MAADLRVIVQHHYSAPKQIMFYLGQVLESVS